MATRSHIGILNPNNTVTYIYCHFDGYLEHNGDILQKHYATENRVRMLIELGDLSYLAEEIGEQQDFDNILTHNDKWCLAYGRDRGKSNTEARTVSYEEYTKDDMEAYTYLFIPDMIQYASIPGFKWRVRSYGAKYWTDLNDALHQVTI